MKKTRVPVIVLVLAAIGAAAWWYSRPAETPGSTTEIAASGFIEARDIAIASETGGRITYVGAAEGDTVQAGAVLVRLDDSLLKTQQAQAEAAVRVAQAGLQQATTARDGALRTLQNAQDLQRNPLELDARINAAQGELDLADLNLRFSDARQGPWDRQAAQLRRDIAKKNLDNLLAIKADPQEINASVDRSRAAYDAAQASLDVVKAQIEQAQRAVDVVVAQIKKTVVTAPAAGVVSSRHAEPGEVAQPGAPVLVITQLQEVTLTIYVPESRLGLVKLGQVVNVTVDSYAEQVFTGKVAHISPRAQFTPKNVQLKDERTRTVYSVKISLANPDQKLKAGMPADALILTGG